MKKSPPKQLSLICMFSSLFLLKIILNKNCPLILCLHVIFLQLTSILLWFDHSASTNILRYTDIFLAIMLGVHVIYKFYKINYLWKNIDIPIIFLLNIVNYKLFANNNVNNHILFVLGIVYVHLRTSYTIDNLINIKYS